MKSIEDIKDFVFMNSPLSKADLIIVPGSLSYQTVELAADLYKKGYAPKVLASGGYSKDIGRFEWEKIKKEAYRKEFETEFEYMKYILVENGVPEEAILKEDKSQYTFENALKSKEVLEELNMEVKKVILVAKDYHTRRCFMYFDYVFEDVEFLMAAATIHEASRDNWTKSELGIRVIMREFKKISKQFYNLYVEDMGRINGRKNDKGLTF